MKFLPTVQVAVFFNLIAFIVASDEPTIAPVASDPEAKQEETATDCLPEASSTSGLLSGVGGFVSCFVDGLFGDITGTLGGLIPDLGGIGDIFGGIGDLIPGLGGGGGIGDFIPDDPTGGLFRDGDEN